MRISSLRGPVAVAPREPSTRPSTWPRARSRSRASSISLNSRVALECCRVPLKSAARSSVSSFERPSTSPTTLSRMRRGWRLPTRTVAPTATISTGSREHAEHGRDARAGQNALDLNDHRGAAHRRENVWRAHVKNVVVRHQLARDGQSDPSVRQSKAGETTRLRDAPFRSLPHRRDGLAGEEHAEGRVSDGGDGDQLKGKVSGHTSAFPHELVS